MDKNIEHGCMDIEWQIFYNIFLTLHICMFSHSTAFPYINKLFIPIYWCLFPYIDKLFFSAHTEMVHFCNYLIEAKATNGLWLL